MSIIGLVNINPLLFHAIVIIASLIVLIKAADLAVYGIVRYARKLGISDYLIGLIVISLAASLPELVSSLNGSVIGDTGIVFGTILGSNVCGIGLVIGVLALVGKRVSMECKIFEKTKSDIFLLSLLPFVLLLDSKLNRFDGVLLIIAYFIWIGLLWKREGELGKVKKDVKLKHIYRDALIFIGCLVAILLAARWIVFSSVNIAKLLAIPSYIVALIVIGIGSSIPDLTVGIRSVVRHHASIGVGDALGSLVMKSLLFFGILALINPLVVEWSTIIIAFFFITIILALVLKFTKDKVISWREGLMLVLLYFAFLFLQIFWLVL